MPPGPRRTARPRCRWQDRAADQGDRRRHAAGQHVDVDDNLFEVGASSLTLIQIHEKIDELFRAR